ncbi:MAG TPA: NADH-quinone oxidoreductase subunit NuoH [Anaerolineales bacterium]|nr:NADH-quinone oxidoreductase subunit NuoH [Anaerolineales bacterium]
MNFLNDPINFVASWLHGLLTGWRLPDGLATVIVYFIGIVVLVIFAMTLDIGLVWVERKVVARFQDRLGPNRIGPFGLIQPVADIIKLVIKEDITPAGADKIIYNIAPVLAAMSVIALWAILPLSSKIFGVDLNVAVLYLVAAGALGTLAIIMAGWSSNNKYALLGAFRMVANIVSYEIPMVVTLLIPVILADTMSVQGITQAQSGMWFAILSPLAAIIFLISAIAELGRSPFDLTEAESELTAGFNVEYSGMKFGWFYASELLHAFTYGGFMAVMFFGGYGGFFGLETIPGFHWLTNPFVEALVFIAKGMLGYWVIMWIKYSMPRIRIDHMLAFNWKFLTPLSLVVLVDTAVLSKLLSGLPAWEYVLGMFLSNVIIAVITVEILRGYGRKQRLAEERLPAQAVHN